jgi:bacteriocin-like protein
MQAKPKLRELNEQELEAVSGGVPPWTNNGGHQPPGQSPNPNPGK